MQPAASGAGTLGSGCDVTLPLCGESQGPLCLGGPRPGPHKTTRLWGGKDGAGSLGVGSFRVGTHVLAAEVGPTTRAAARVAAPGARSRTSSVGAHGEAGRCKDPLGREKISPSGDSLRCSRDWLSRLSDRLARSEGPRLRGTELRSNFVRVKGAGPRAAAAAAGAEAPPRPARPADFAPPLRAAGRPSSSCATVPGGWPGRGSRCELVWAAAGAGPGPAKSAPRASFPPGSDGTRK